MCFVGFGPDLGKVDVARNMLRQVDHDTNRSVVVATAGHAPRLHTSATTSKFRTLFHKSLFPTT